MKALQSIVKGLWKVVKFALIKDFEILKYSYRVVKYTSVATFLMLSTCFLVDALIQWIHPLPPLVTPYLFDMSDPIVLASICLSIGLIEEGTFRYLIYDCVFKQWLKAPIWIAILASSIFFGAAHFNNAIVANISLLYVLPQVCGAAVLGLLFVYLYRKFGLHLAIVVHAVYDFMIFSTINNPAVGKFINIAYVLGIVVLICMGISWLVNRKVKYGKSW